MSTNSEDQKRAIREGRPHLEGPRMTGRWPGILVATLCCLAVAASASAESGWYLMGRNLTTGE